MARAVPRHRSRGDHAPAGQRPEQPVHGVLQGGGSDPQVRAFAHGFVEQGGELADATDQGAADWRAFRQRRAGPEQGGAHA
jgi:hypothetical protein